MYNTFFSDTKLIGLEAFDKNRFKGWIWLCLGFYNNVTFLKVVPDLTRKFKVEWPSKYRRNKTDYKTNSILSSCCIVKIMKFMKHNLNLVWIYGTHITNARWWGNGGCTGSLLNPPHTPPHPPRRSLSLYIDLQVNCFTQVLEQNYFVINTLEEPILIFTASNV